VCVARGRVGIDRFCSDRVNAESDGGCTGRGGPSDRGPEALATAQATLEMQLVTLYASLPARTAVVLTGHSDPRRMILLNARKVAFESAVESGKKVEEMNRCGPRVMGGRWKRSRMPSVGCYLWGSSRPMCTDCLRLPSGRVRRRSMCWLGRCTLVRLPHSHTQTRSQSKPNISTRYGDGRTCVGCSTRRSNFRIQVSGQALGCGHKYLDDDTGFEEWQC
jgi:hypothetical protein